jgi:hypothetical protein
MSQFWIRRIFTFSEKQLDQNRLGRGQACLAGLTQVTPSAPPLTLLSLNSRALVGLEMSANAEPGSIRLGAAIKD